VEVVFGENPRDDVIASCTLVLTSRLEVYECFVVPLPLDCCLCDAFLHVSLLKTYDIYHIEDLVPIFGTSIIVLEVSGCVPNQCESMKIEFFLSDS